MNKFLLTIVLESDPWLNLPVHVTLVKSLKIVEFLFHGFRFLFTESHEKGTQLFLENLRMVYELAYES